jgi:hypothetical protein
MKLWALVAASLLAAPWRLLPQIGPIPDEETLQYAVNWPSGLSLGEARTMARTARPAEGRPARREFEFILDASVPGFVVADRFRSVATPGLCSLEFGKDSSHGKRKAQERSTFDPERKVVTRVTLGGGGQSEIPVAACAKDALTFLYFLRQELHSGRLPPAQTILFGAPYQIRLQHAGVQSIVSGDSRVEADRLTAILKGPASEVTFEMWFARDEPRTLLQVRASLPTGVFSMELVR